MGLITNEAEQTTRADNEENIDQPVEINDSSRARRSVKRGQECTCEG